MTPEDRFGDLGPGDKRDTRSAAERLEERDRTHPEPDAGPPEVPRPSSRYAWVVGVAFLLVIIVAGVNSIPNEGRAIRGPERGKRMPSFSAPIALSSLSGDANVCQKGPCPKSAGSVPACDVRNRDVLTSCDLWERSPLILTFVFDRGADCFPQLDRVQRARRRLGVNTAAVYFSRNDRDEVRATVRRRGWTMPVALDKDGAVANLYRVGGCPTTIFVYKGGKVRKARLGLITEDQLVAEARRLRRER